MPQLEPAPLRLRDYQQTAATRIEQAWDSGHRRLVLTMPCGTGKTVVMAALLNTRPDLAQVVVFVPTLRLLTQTAAVLHAARPTAALHAVCSAAALDIGHTVTDSDDDIPPAAAAAAIGATITTDPEILAAAVGAPGDHLVVATYASAAVVAEATRILSRPWDLMICDEAHHTAGDRDKAWALPITDTAIPARRRLFATATVRVVDPPRAEDPDDGPVEILSMNSLRDYGAVHSVLSLRDAITAGHLSDYRVATIAVSEASALALLTDYNTTQTPAQQLDLDAAAAQLALLRAADTNPDMRSVLVFHNRIATSRAWAAQLRALAKTTHTDIAVYHVDGDSDPRHISAALNALADPGDRLVVVSNCRLFAEGVDIPALDAVMFAAPRTGTPDIVQIIGRAVRPHPAGHDRRALIVLPVLHRPGDTASTEDRVARTRYLTAWQVLTVLAEEDDLIFRALLQRRLEAEHGQPADTDTHDRIRFDTSDLPANIHDPFILKTVRRTTSGWIRTWWHLRRYVTRTGNPPTPRRGLRVPDPSTPDGYPLGERLAALRRAAADGRVPARIIDMFDNDPALTGWRDPHPATTRRTADQWLDLVASHLTTTGARTIDPWHTTTGPSGTSIAIGKWVAKLRPHTLTPPQRQRLTHLLPTQFPAPETE